MSQIESPSVSVLMPTYEQSRFIGRALDSLQAQILPDWDAIIVDDGSKDATAQAVLPYLSDPRIHYYKFAENKGLGNALNEGLAKAKDSLIAYLPSDDVYYRGHLKSLKQCLETEAKAVLAYSGVRHHYNRQAAGQISGFPLQLVQCMRRKTGTPWPERQELESDDLERLYWAGLRHHGPFVGSANITCEWVDHPLKRHKLMQEPVGGINPFRVYYRGERTLTFSHIGRQLHR